MRIAWIPWPSAAAICAILLCAAPVDAWRADPQRDQLEQILRAEGEAVLELADLAAAGRRVPSDFRVQWQHVFLKAQKGTFVPFTLTVDTTRLTRSLALVYVRAVRREPGTSRRSQPSPGEARRPSEEDRVPADAVFPVEFIPESGHTARVHRGFVLAPGDYEVFVVVRERVDPAAPRVPRAAVLARRLEVPDFESDELTTSSMILADHVAVLEAPLRGEELLERPFVIGQHEITPAGDRTLRRTEELIIVFLIYNPLVTLDGQFDVQVEYHFFRRGGPPRSAGEQLAARPAARDGEQYFNHTDPQRFTPRTLGGSFDPAGRQPVMAGQGISLAGFGAGEYRLAIKVTDRLADRSVLRDVEFTVRP